jgi:uridylate kinase
MFKRVVIKISGEALGDSSNNFNDEIIGRIVLEVSDLISQGIEVSLVVGGGNFWRGREANEGMDKVTADQIGMLATIMNGLYLADYFIQKGIEAIVMTPFEVNSFTEKYSKKNTLNHIKNGRVVIFSGGTGHPYFSTDTIVALRACELNADAVLFAKNIDGVYDSDPKLNINAKKYKTVSYKHVISAHLVVADIPAIDLTYNSDIPCVVFALDIKDSICIACKNNDEIYEIGGTLISNKVMEEFYVK